MMIKKYKEKNGLAFPEKTERDGGSGSGMKFFMDRQKFSGIDVSIDLRSGNIRVSQHFLDHAEVGPVFKEMSREGMPESVRMDLLFDSGELCRILHDHPDSFTVKRFSPVGKKQCGFAAVFDQAWSDAEKVSFHSL